MKNPFRKHNNSKKLVAGLALGAVFAGAITYLYIKRKAGVDAAAAELKDQAKKYLKAKRKSIKSK